MSHSRLINRNVTAARGRTSMRMEPELWDALQEICLRERLSLGEFVRRVEGADDPGGRTSAVRVFVLRYFRDAATNEGHRLAGHGTIGPDQDGTARTVAAMGQGRRTAGQSPVA